MNLFMPKQAFFEKDTLAYPLGQKLHQTMTANNIPIKILGPGNRIGNYFGNTSFEKYIEAKKSLVVGVRKNLKLTTCKPSADWEFPLASSCPGGCQYCYLQTHLGKRPFVKVYVNIDEILNKIKTIADENVPQITSFEAASTSDPLASEHLTGSLAQTITFFGTLTHGRMRVVSKFNNIDSLLNLPHNQHTRFRFSLNTPKIIKELEYNTPQLPARIKAASQMAQAGYPLGFIIAPLFIYSDYQTDYRQLFETLAQTLEPIPADLTFELITHRFTKAAKNVILERFPDTPLELDETKRGRKYGKYGLVKYIYPKEEYQELRETISSLVSTFFPQATISYFT